MVEIRFNYGDKFTQTSDSNTGIGSTIPAGKLDVAGNTKAGSLRVSGIATLSSVSGFVNTKLTTSTQDMIVEAGNSGSVSGEVVVSTGQTISVSTGATTGQGGIQSLKVSKTFMPPVGGTADRPTDVKPGMVYYNKDFKTIEFWDGNFWKQVDNTTRNGRSVYGGGFGTPGTDYQQSIEVFKIPSGGQAVNFGVLPELAINRGFCANSIRGLFGGGTTPSPTYINDIDYVNMQAEGDAIDFGDLSTTRATYGGSLSSSTRGLWTGGYGPSASNVIDYVEIMTLGNALDFGDLVTANWNITAASSPTRGFTFGGSPNNPRYVTVTIASKGNAIDFGALAASVNSAMGCANPTRAVIMGGQNPTNIATMETIQMSSGGNFVIFGELTEERSLGTGSATATRACSISGRTPENSSSSVKNIEFIEFASLGNATFFGEAAQQRQKFMGGSDSHGGLGGF